MARTVKKSEERRAEIVTAALELFLEKDYHNTTMQDVINKVNIAKGTIYHYFKSKEELLDAVVALTVQTYVDQVKRQLAGTSGDALNRMHVLIKASDASDGQADLLARLHRPGNIGLHTRQLALTVSMLAPLYAQIIEQGCEEGIFQPGEALSKAEMLLAGIQFLTDCGCNPWATEDIERRIAAIPAIMECLLGAPKGSFAFILNLKNKGS